ncbi:hypothetical protein LP420_32435 [Massilia sp. B-10]|nr:hypothetical protein LP420_32435 [Massilia sp. B-10]
MQLMLSLEMIGYFSDLPDSQSYPVPAMAGLYPERGNFIALVGKFGDFGMMRRAKAIMAGATALPVEIAQCAASRAGRRLFRSPQLLAPRLSGADGDRHVLHAQSALPQGGRHA